MKMRWIGIVMLFLGLVPMVSCGSDNAAAPTTPGTITVSVDAIQGQNGKVLAVMVYAYDWQPGDAGAPAGGVTAQITSDNFSFSNTVQTLDVNSQPTGTTLQFQPGDYSVVFFIAPNGEPPEYYAESRVSVDGDLTTNAPAWGGWTD